MHKGPKNDIWEYDVAQKTWTFVRGSQNVYGTESSVYPGSLKHPASTIAGTSVWVYGGALYN